jgi:hypothetical protein
MPAFNAVPAIGLYPGDVVVLVNNAATDSGLTYTQQVAVTDAGPYTLANGTNQTATVYVAAKDSPASTANYQPLTDADTGVAVTVASSSTITFTSQGHFICAHYGSSPTTGSLVIAR